MGKLLNIILISILSALSAASAQQPSSVWIGLAIGAEESGLRVQDLPFGSPAEKAGVFLDDLIVAVNGEELRAADRFVEFIRERKAGDEITLRVLRDGITKSGADAANDELWRNPELYVMKQPLGATVQLNAVRERNVMEIEVVVEARPAGMGRIKEYPGPDAAPGSFSKVSRAEEELANRLIDEFNIRDAYRDLRQRLARLSKSGDPFRLSRLAYIQHEPFQARTVAARTLDGLASAMNQRNSQAMIQMAAEWLDAPIRTSSPPLKTGLTLDEHLDQLSERLTQARAKRDEAFAPLSADERRHAQEYSSDVFAAFSIRVNLQQDADRARWRRNMRVIESASRVDFAKLFEGAELVAGIADPRYLEDLEAALTKAWRAAGRPEGIFINRDSRAGKILVGGHGSSWYTEDAAILLDLAGRDFYTNNSGSSRGDKIPAAVLIDFAGDDAYEATYPWAQGSAHMGYGLLIDRLGDDQYLGTQWAQGAAVLGAALFLDEDGDDVYRADEYAQGVAAWAVAIHSDYFGDDIYDSHLLSQGVGMAGGAGWLLNGAGDDRYYAKGKRPTAYGDVGIFDSWSQGSGIGFRGMQSGGIGLIYDAAGRDRYESGNFSQGGGYYFGVGMLRDGGKENDVYIGSRYSQGYTAHQAFGYFEEMGGNDFYTTRHAVAQGLSWDESITVFIDHAGDDVYEGGGGFSQGASAHNGFCLFLDLGGRNRFVYGSPQGSAGPNDYHGGKSFSLFVTAEDKGRPAGVRLNGDHGFSVTLNSSIEAAVRKGRL